MSISKCINTVIASSLLVLLAGCAHDQGTKDNPTSHNAREQKASIETIWNDYKENFSEATSKWTQVNIVVTGTVNNVETKDFPSQQNKDIAIPYYLVTLQDQVNTSCTGVIKMSNDTTTKQQVSTLKKGNVVTIKTNLYQPERFITGDIPKCSFLFDNGVFKPETK
ncbi:OB-fold putative lipoprotein [Entomomonas sp. E2T0]|uniref:OB-fold putative lipoprotein n=1 Tax=Entomomonas sp. E2T0 TaxID=2930213 RepID=UPI0022284B3F|nr:OB-fold putative lipoprotein [Entomomonas sp. E2T0]UYZ82976.1 OB-fold putative lipoprotein [Entomomonas sp. E2T0]